MWQAAIVCLWVHGVLNKFAKISRLGPRMLGQADEGYL